MAARAAGGLHGSDDRRRLQLSARRDLGAGLLPSRPGPPHARPSLLGPLGLAWRLQRGVFAGWAAALIVVGVAYGAVAPEVDDLVGDSEGTRDIFERLGGGARNLTDAYLAATLAITGVAVAAYTIQASLRLRGEESGGTLEPVLAAAVEEQAALARKIMSRSPSPAPSWPARPHGRIGSGSAYRARRRRHGRRATPASPPAPPSSRRRRRSSSAG